MSNKKQFEEIVESLSSSDCEEFWMIGGSICFVSACQETKALGIFMEKIKNDEIKQSIVETTVEQRDDSEKNRQLFIDLFQNK